MGRSLDQENNARVAVQKSKSKSFRFDLPPWLRFEDTACVTGSDEKSESRPSATERRFLVGLFEPLNPRRLAMAIAIAYQNEPNDHFFPI